nr:FimD/PapC N-terminal domain-containing protein [Escherichia coli]
MPRFARLTIALGLATAVFPVDAEYYFNPRFLSNDLAESVDLSAFTKGREAPPGTYRVDIYLNDEWICPYISRHLLSLNPLLTCCRRYSRGER